ncbi:hypothetical protein GE09DRAFT_1052538 [Coniochaeta sp. 2T2.1]|nr:hypothetical protein GE09DRAFT_1052538 [Coniochaeta sp. 2T2.1]
MERPAKRARTGSFFHHDDEADDELFYDPAEINAQRDPAVILEKSRAVATFKLKSRWEDVFKKYEQDFTGEDDIINFYGSEPELEVDNGHLRSLEDADDGKSVEASDTADLEEEERILHGNAAGGGQLARMGPSSLMAHPSFGGRLSALAPGPPKLSTMFSPGFQVPSYSPFGSAFKSFNAPADSMWNAPELPPEAFDNYAIATTVPKRRVVRQALMAAEEDGSDEEDDILMGNTPSWRQEKETEKEKEQPASPGVALQEPSAVEGAGVPEEDAIERVQTAETISDLQAVVTPPPRRKVGRLRLKPRELTPTEDAMAIEPQNSPHPEVPQQQPQPAAEPAAKPAAPAEQFSRNAIDKDYGFSDEDTAWVPPSRVRKTSKQVKKPSPSSTPNRSVVKRRPKVSTFLGSSPSIRAAFPVVKRSLQATRTKPQEDVSPCQQPEQTEATPDEVALDNVPDPVALPTPKTEASVIVITDDPDLPTPDVNEISPSPVVPADMSKPQPLPTTPSTNQTKEKTASEKRSLATPSSRQSKPKRTSTPSTYQPSTSKRSILSLLSDSDEDELSLSLDPISPLARSVHNSNHHAALPIRSRSSTAKKPSGVKRLSLGSYARATPQQQKKSRLSSGWSASAAKAVRRKSDVAEDPDVHRTPRGTLRRCGEDGFKCERDFCFTCL